MSPTIGLVMALAAAAGHSFRADFPAAAVKETGAGGRLIQATGFSAPGLGSTPQAAAHAFLRRYGADFGITARQQLAARRNPHPGQVVAVTFERRIDGRPVFDADVVVGVDSTGAVILVNASDVPTRISGKAVISGGAALRAAKAAIPGLEGGGEATVERGWRGWVDVIRPVWRVDFVATRPPGDWRTYVDAQTGKVLLRMDRRASFAKP